MKQNDIARLLPAVFQQTLQPGTPLSALLSVMEALPAPDEAILERLATFFNPYHTPDNFVPFLASWVDLEWLLVERATEYTNLTPALPSGVGRLRELIASATFLAQWRGTAKGLLRFLETASGVPGFTIDERVPGPDGRPKPFHIAIGVPAEVMPYQALLKRIIEAEKPAYVTYELNSIDHPVQNTGTPLPETNPGPPPVEPEASTGSTGGGMRNDKIVYSENILENRKEREYTSMKGLKIFLVVLFIVGLLFIVGTSLGASHSDDQSAQTPNWLTNLGAKLVISQPLKVSDLTATPASCLAQNTLTIPSGATCTFAIQKSTFTQRVVTLQLVQGASAKITLAQEQVVPVYATLTGIGATTTTDEDLKVYPGKEQGLLSIQCNAGKNVAVCILSLK